MRAWLERWPLQHATPASAPSCRWWKSAACAPTAAQLRSPDKLPLKRPVDSIRPEHGGGTGYRQQLDAIGLCSAGARAAPVRRISTRTVFFGSATLTTRAPLRSETVPDGKSPPTKSPALTGLPEVPGRILHLMLSFA